MKEQKRMDDENSSKQRDPKLHCTGTTVADFEFNVLQKVYQLSAKHNRDKSMKEQKRMDDENSSKQRDPKLHCTGTTVADFEFNVVRLLIYGTHVIQKVFAYLAMWNKHSVSQNTIYSILLIREKSSVSLFTIS
ncbi:hypothetical protein AHF37_08621 [Paragonimus kellicotti]|nr:hypothetical protein AHF37_08621 [Paragonimus kellicotti]